MRFWRRRDEKVRVRMGDGIAFVVDESYRHFVRRWRRSMRRRYWWSPSRRWIEIHSEAGRRRILNPHQIVYVEQACYQPSLWPGRIVDVLERIGGRARVDRVTSSNEDAE